MTNLLPLRSQTPTGYLNCGITATAGLPAPVGGYLGPSYKKALPSAAARARAAGTGAAVALQASIATTP